MCDQFTLLTMKARFETKCARCGNVIRMGQSVVRPFGKPPWHAACYGKYAVQRGIDMNARLNVR